MTTLKFAKGHVSGNDFILLTDADGSVPLTADTVRRLCDRHTGVGADGVIRAVRSEAIADGAPILSEEPLAEWFMDSWSADGTASAMCGNSIRLLAHYLIGEGHISPERRDTIPIGTRAGVRDVLRGIAGYTVDLGRWRLDSDRLVSAHGLGVDRPGLSIDLGSQHVVTAVASLEELQRVDLGAGGDTADGAGPEVHPAPDAPVNIEFVSPEEHVLKNGVAHIRMRVHKAGSGETQSCGTGAAAAALAFRHWGGDAMPNSWSVESPGGKVAVRMFPTEEGEHVSLSGPVEIVYRGQITL